MNRALHFAGILLACIVLLTACSKDEDSPTNPNPPAQNDTVSFSRNVLPIFSTRGCISCHGGQNNLFVGSVAQLLQGGDNGPAIVPSNADSSLLVRKIGPNPPFGARMPQGGPFLTDTEIQTIRNWINQGALNN